jgi:hypothetical protein
MINIVTVHWQTPKWVDVQLGYLKRHIDAPYRVFAALNGIDDPALWRRFFFAEDLPGKHDAKLNTLANIATENSTPGDVLIFLDGDAFPVRAIHPWVEETLQSYRLAAIRRDENLGDVQPHPSFCATTIGFWNDIGGDWHGEAWTNAAGREVVDAGGRLFNELRARDIDWLPLLRTNTHNPHPLWFGVYDHRIYHHGAGFQMAPAERVDWADRYRKTPGVGRPLRPTPASPSLGTLRARFKAGELQMRRLRPRHAGVLRRAAMKSFRLRREHRYFERRRSSQRGRALGEFNDQVFAQLSTDPGFFRQFDDRGPGTPTGSDQP